MEKDKYNVFNLSKSHKELFTKYLTYLKNKENTFIKEVISYVNDFKNEK